MRGIEAVSILLAFGTASINGYPEYTYKEGAVCQAEPGRAVNTLSSLPLLSVQPIQSASRDFRSYKVFKPCDDVEAGCSPILNFDQDTLLAGDIEESSLQTLIKSIGVYGAVGAFLYILSIFVILCAPICCCCCKKSKILTATVQPDGTLKTKRKANCCNPRLGQFFLVLFAIFSFGVIIGGDLNGNIALTDAPYALVATVPEDTAITVSALPDPVETFFINIFGASLVTGLERISQTFKDAVNLEEVHNSFLCLGRILDIASPSRLGYFVGVLNDIGSAIEELPQGNSTSDAFRSLDASLSALVPSVGGVSILIGNLSDSLGGIDTAGIRNALNDLNSTLKAELKPTLLDLKAEVGKMTANDTKPPTSTEVNTTISLLVTFRDEPSSSTANALIDDLSVMSSRLSSMADTAVLADTVNNAGLVFDETQTSLSNLVAVLRNAQAQLGRIPTVEDASITINKVSDAIESFDMDSVVEALESLDEFISRLPNITELASNVNALTGVRVEIPCVLQLGSVITRVNESLLALPASLNGISDMFQGLNTSVGESLSQVDGMNDFMDTLNSTLSDLPDVGSYIGTVRNQGSQMNDSKSQLDTVKSEITDMGGKVDGANFTDIIVEIEALQAELSASPVRLNESELAVMRDLNATRQDSITNIDQAIEVVQLWETNFGASGTAGVCPDNTSPCGPGVDSPPCTEEQCSYSQVKEQIDSTVSELSTFQSNAGEQPSFDELLSGLDTAVSSVDAVPEMDTAALNDLDGVIGDLLPKLADYQSDMDTLSADLSNTLSSLDVPSLVSQWEDVQAMLDGMSADLDTYSAGIQSMNGTLGGLTGPESMLALAMKMETRLNNLLSRDLALHLDTIRVAPLRATLESDGLSAVYEKVVDALDAIVGSFDDPVPDGENPPPGMLKAMMNGTEESLNMVFELLHVSKAERYRITDPKHGPVSYLVKVFGVVVEDLNSIQLTDGELMSGVLTLEGGYHAGSFEPYEENTYCVTEECLRNTLKLASAEPLIHLLLPDAGFSLPLSREMALRLPYVIPIITAILALLTACAPGASIPLVCCTIFTMPSIFLFVGVLLFPLVLTMGTFCAAVEPLGLSVVEQMQPWVCAELNGTSVSGVCMVPFPLGGSELMLPLETLAIAEGIVAGSCDAGTGLDRVYEHLANNIPSTVSTMVSAQLGGFGLKQDLMADVTFLSSSVGNNVGELVRGIGDTLGCEFTNDLYMGVKDAFCCNIVGSIYVFVSSWYLLGFGMLCCALPGSHIACRNRRKMDLVLPAPEK